MEMEEAKGGEWVLETMGRLQALEVAMSIVVRVAAGDEDFRRSLIAGFQTFGKDALQQNRSSAESRLYKQWEQYAKAAPTKTWYKTPTNPPKGGGPGTK